MLIPPLQSGLCIPVDIYYFAPANRGDKGDYKWSCMSRLSIIYSGGLENKTTATELVQQCYQNVKF